MQTNLSCKVATSLCEGESLRQPAKPVLRREAARMRGGSNCCVPTALSIQREEIE